MLRRKGRFGNSTLEFTLVGIPLIFTLISIFEMGRGMWMYHTMAYAIKEGTRYAVVHGQGCTPPTNTCQIKIKDVAQRIKDAGIGLDANDLELTFLSGPGLGTQIGPSTLTTCLADNTVWPAAPDNFIALPLQINGIIPFKSALAMFWPGVRSGAGARFGSIYFPATSQERIEY